MLLSRVSVLGIAENHESEYPPLPLILQGLQVTIIEGIHFDLWWGFCYTGSLLGAEAHSEVALLI